jgi:hypothetical protein
MYCWLYSSYTYHIIYVLFSCLLYKNVKFVDDRCIQSKPPNTKNKQLSRRELCIFLDTFPPLLCMMIHIIRGTNQSTDSTERWWQGFGILWHRRYASNIHVILYKVCGIYGIDADMRCAHLSVTGKWINGNRSGVDSEPATTVG